jgi:hypothetical protein
MVLLWFKMLGHKEPIHSCDMECLNVSVLKMFSNMIHCCNACMLCDRLWGGRKSDLFGSGFKKLNPARKTDVIKATNL